MTTDWSARRWQNTQSMKEHILILEDELIRVRKKLESRSEAINTINLVGERVQKIALELSWLFRELGTSHMVIFGLSAKEKRVYDCVRSNRSLVGKELAEKLGMSHRVFKFHLTNIFRKMGISSRNEL